MKFTITATSLFAIALLSAPSFAMAATAAAAQEQEGATTSSVRVEEVGKSTRTRRGGAGKPRGLSRGGASAAAAADADANRKNHDRRLMMAGGGGGKGGGKGYCKDQAAFDAQMQKFTAACVELARDYFAEITAANTAVNNDLCPVIINAPELAELADTIGLPSVTDVLNVQAEVANACVTYLKDLDDAAKAAATVADLVGDTLPDISSEISDVLNKINLLKTACPVLDSTGAAPNLSAATTAAVTCTTTNGGVPPAIPFPTAVPPVTAVMRVTDCIL